MMTMTVPLPHTSAEKPPMEDSGLLLVFNTEQATSETLKDYKKYKHGSSKVKVEQKNKQYIPNQAKIQAENNRWKLGDKHRGS